MEHTTPNDGTNPHAEIATGLLADFRTDPSRWIYENVGDRFARPDAAGTLARAHGALVALLDPMDEPSMVRDAEALAVLFAGVASTIGWSARDASEFVRFGPLLVPAAPSGLRALRAIRADARKRIDGIAIHETADRDSTLGQLLCAIKSANESPGSAILLRARNRSALADPEKSTRGIGARIAFDFHPRAMATLPMGNTLPPALLAPALEGFHVSDPCELQRECDMCEDGTAEFLDKFGIDYERDGTYECDSCGTEHENPDGGEIGWIEPFTLSADMLDAIERQGFGDAVRDYLGSEAGTDSLATLLDEQSESEILERCSPDTENGIRYDRDTWTFEPDLESVEGAEDLEGAEALRAGALLSKILARHESSPSTSASFLPPIAGTLEYRPVPLDRDRIDEPGESSAPARRISLDWDPQHGKLAARLGVGLRLVIDVRTGARWVRLWNGMELPILPNGGEWIARIGLPECGDRARLALWVAHSTAEI